MGLFYTLIVYILCVQFAASSPVSDEVATTKDQFNLPVNAPTDVNNIASKTTLTSKRAAYRWKDIFTNFPMVCSTIFYNK